MQKYIFFLGHQPHLSLAELESVFGAESILKIKKNYAVLKLAEEPNIDQLGGTTKISKLLKIEDLEQDLNKQILDLLFTQISEQKTTKLKLGVSVYSGKNIAQLNIKVIREILEKLRKKVEKEFPELNLRTVEPKESALNTAQIIHGGLLKNGGLSLDLLISEQEVILAQTIQVPNLKKYTLRDYGKPKPSGKNGMLPPKLAQILLNLSGAKKGDVVLDPFCGSGTVLQEAILLGINSIGTDLNPKIIEDAKANLEWLDKRFRLRDSKVKFNVYTADATSHQWEKDVIGKFNHVVCESYLGTPMTNTPTDTKLSSIIQECNSVAEGFLKNIHPQLEDSGTLVFALPCWFVNDEIKRLPVVENLSALGYNQVKYKKVNQEDSFNLIYRRTGKEKSQIVGRDIYVLNKAKIN
jgi:tRNA G10  N-methylase Trm11